MASEISNGQNILILVGSSNKIKAAAAKEGILKFHPGAAVRVVELQAEHGISDWKSRAAPGQPFGLRQTSFGAINRMQYCWNRSQQYINQNERLSHLYVVGFENGLVEGKEIERDSDKWYDVCVTAVREVLSNSAAIVMRGASVLTEFGSNKERAFDDQVIEYHAAIMPRVNRKIDLYLEWTKDLEGGPFTRGDYLRNCLTNALEQLSVVQKAKSLVQECAAVGVVASLGPRYRNMIWMRDLAYMTPAYVMCGQKSALINALRTLCQKQCQKHELCDNGYERLNQFGNLPIVTVSDTAEREFLLQRLQGTENDPYWQIQLWNYCKKNNALSHFPAPSGKECAQEPPSLQDCSLQQLRDYYRELVQFRNQLTTSGDTPPAPSYALTCFMEGLLANITPGTRDSEIHFIRALLNLAESTEKENLLAEFAKPLAGALFYLYTNVIDHKDALPKGCDSRDIFADLLYDAKTLSNALFWFDALKALHKLSATLEKTALRKYLTEAIENSKAISQKVPEILQKMAFYSSPSLCEIFAEELKTLEASIKEKLLFKNNTFAPRDFIPGVRATLGLGFPLIPNPATSLIMEYNPDFVRGESVDPQSLAYAVLQGLIPENEYDRVVDYFLADDSPIGVSVFVPISGKTKEETELLRKVKGRVVWPHVSWTVFRAALFMGTPKAMRLALELREKLTKLGFGEWYAMNEGRVIQGGDPQQGWSASSMLVAEAEVCTTFSQG